MSQSALPIVFSALAFAFSTVSLILVLVFSPIYLSKILEAKAKALSTHTVVPGELIDLLDKKDEYNVSSRDIEYSEHGPRPTSKASYG